MRSRLRDIWRTVTPPAWRGALVLLYHRIGPAGIDPWRLAVSPEHLDEHLDILARSCRVLAVAELVRALDERRLPQRAVVITFDDGYADLATAARPRLERADLRATAFVVSRAIDRNREFWWDEVERAILGSSAPDRPIVLEVGGTAVTVDPAAGGSRRELHRSVWTLLRERPPDERDDLARSLLDWAGLSIAARPTHRPLTAAEFDALAEGDRMDIGAHTADHAWLAGLSHDAVATQMECGRVELERRLNRPVASVAYPHGGRDDVGHGPEIAQSSGLTTGFMAAGGTVRPGADQLRLPRLFVEDLDGEGFGRLLWRQAGIRT